MMAQRLLLIRTKAFKATCDCGWKAPRRNSFLRALADFDRHDEDCKSG